MGVSHKYIFIYPEDVYMTPCLSDSLCCWYVIHRSNWLCFLFFYCVLVKHKSNNVKVWHGVLSPSQFLYSNLKIPSVLYLTISLCDIVSVFLSIQLIYTSLTV